MAALRISYQTIAFDKVDIHLRTLRNTRQFLDVNGVAEKLNISSASWPIFGVVWPSSVILAHFLHDYQYKNKRILEVGCGIGLVSLMLNHFLADITATDIHPEVENFFLENILLNKGKNIRFVRTGWGDAKTNMGEFDLIVGSDLLYEDEHIELLAGFIDQHANPHCEIIIVDPKRGRNAKFSKKMVSLGYTHNANKPINSPDLEKTFKGHILHYCR